MGFLKKLFGGGGDGVKFVRRYTQAKSTPYGMATFKYEIYRAKTAQEAREFLESKKVAERLSYIVVETPEGNWGKDIEGMYKEKG